MTPSYFSNITNAKIPVLAGRDCLAYDVALATSAAPVYFPSYTINNDAYGSINGTYIDGGLALNNPGSMAIKIAKALHPTKRRVCTLVVSNGLGTVGRQPSPEPDPPTESVKSLQNLQGPLDIANLFKLCLDISTGVPPECVSLEIDLGSRYTLDNEFSYIFQYQLTDEAHPNADLDNATDEFIQFMLSSSAAHFNSEQEQRKMDNFIRHFLL